jgi:hypothetical protein
LVEFFCGWRYLVRKYWGHAREDMIFRTMNLGFKDVRFVDSSCKFITFCI